MGRNKKKTTKNFPWKEILGFLGVVLTAYIGYLGVRTQTEIPIAATQTAEAKSTILTTTSLVPILQASPTTMPNEIQTQVIAPLRFDTTIMEDELAAKIYLGEPVISSRLETKQYSTSEIRINNFDLTKYLTDTKTFACNAGTDLILELGIINTGGDEVIKIANAPTIKIDSIKAINHSQTVHLISPEPAGDGHYQNYYVDFDTSQLGKEIEVLPLDPSQIPEFYTLAIGEEEWFKISLHCNEPGVYTFRVGVRYTYKGVNTFSWDEKEITVTRPDEYFAWWDGLDDPGESSYVLLGYLRWDYDTHRISVSKASIDRWIAP